MIDVSEDELEIVKKIIKKHLPSCEVRVFGSRVMGTAKKYSDLDIAIVTEKNIPEDILYSLKEDFGRSDLPFRVDVLDWHMISDKFKKIIIARYEGLVV